MHLLKRLLVWRWLILGVALGALLALLPTPAGLSPQGQRVLAIAAVATLFFVTEPVPLPAVALLIMVFQVLLGLGTPGEVARSFMSDSVFFIMGSLMISVVLVKQQFDLRIALAILKLTGPRLGHVVFGFVAVSALLASFIGAHTVAAIMLPVGLSLIATLKRSHPQVGRLAVLLMLAIAYGAAVGVLGSPSGGARNAIMLDYWYRLFGLKVSYLDWLIYAYPILLAQIPVVAWILLRGIRAEVQDLRRPMVELRRRLRQKGRMARQDWQVIAVFLLVLLGWITLSDRWGLGTIALMGVAAYLTLGYVRWEDLNRGVNWGVVLLYGATISLGVQMKGTGAAQWVAEGFLSALQPWHLGEGWPLLVAVALFTVLVANSMSSGAAVAILSPITLNLADLTGGSLLQVGFVTVIASTFAYLTVIAAPASTIVYASGYLRPSDFLRVGWKLALASVAILSLFAAFYWPLLAP